VQKEKRAERTRGSGAGGRSGAARYCWTSSCRAIWRGKKGSKGGALAKDRETDGGGWWLIIVSSLGTGNYGNVPISDGSLAGMKKKQRMIIAGEKNIGRNAEDRVPGGLIALAPVTQRIAGTTRGI